MCGINGIVGFNNKLALRELLLDMNQSIIYRGPDMQDIYIDDDIGLGHVRLSILDLSDAGKQPMVSLDKRFIIVFNGEIYNFKELRKTLTDYTFNTQTDTEVVLACISKYGLEAAVNKFEGMFAMAIYDIVSKTTYLVRDRLGKKPLYYNLNNGKLVFSSGVRGVLASSMVEGEINKEVLNCYFNYKTVFSPDTIIKNIFTVQAGCIATFKQGVFEEKPYWKMENQLHTDIRGPYWRVQETTQKLLFKAVDKRLVSDVNLGTFLSGGVDSSAIVASIAQVSKIKQNTISIGFEEGEFDETKYAEIVAKKFKTNHTTIKLKPESFLTELKEALQAMDHPSSDGLNTYIVAKETKKAGITVALSGIGGDELFGGYPIFRFADKVHNNAILKKVNPELYQWAIKSFASITNSAKLNKLGKVAIGKSTLLELFKIFKSTDGHLENGDYFNRFKNLTDEKDFTVSHITMMELHYYLHNILLRDSDQMSMANQLEIRAPFLDHDLVSYILSIPDEFKPLKPGKKLLIDTMGSLLPDEVWNRKKMGFVIPFVYWVNNELKSFCTQNLEWLLENNVVDEKKIKDLLSTLVGAINKRGYEVWNYTVLAYWLRTNKIKV